MAVGIAFTDLVGRVMLGAGVVALLVLAVRAARLGSATLIPRGRRATDRTRAKWLAGALARAGDAVNRARIHWFQITPESFREVTELRQDRGGVACYEYREESGPWSLLEEVVVAERHLFLLARGERAWIRPAHCFPDEAALGRFVDAVRAYQQAASRAPAGVISPAPAHPEGLQPAR